MPVALLLLPNNDCCKNNKFRNSLPQFFVRLAHMHIPIVDIPSGCQCLDKIYTARNCRFAVAFLSSQTSHALQHMK